MTEPFDLDRLCAGQFGTFGGDDEIIVVTVDREIVDLGTQGGGIEFGEKVGTGHEILPHGS